MSDSTSFGEESFRVVVGEVWRNREFMAEWRRLRGSSLGLDSRHPLERMVDEATGHIPDEAEYLEFLRFFGHGPRVV